MQTLRRFVPLVALAAFVPADAFAQACPIPGFSYAAFGDNFISMGNGDTDSYDSAVNSNYAASNCTNNVALQPCVGGVATNGSKTPAISVGANGRVSGSCQVNSTTGTISNSSACSSSTTNNAPVPLPVATLPGSLTGKFPAIVATTNINASGSYSTPSISLSGNNKNLNINNSSTVVMYLTGTGNVLSLSGQARINNNSANPTKLIFMCTNTSAAAKTISVSGNGLGYFAIYCPQASITINGGGSTGDIFGAVVGKSVTFNGNGASVHYDKALANMTSSQITCATAEISRATPVVATNIGAGASKTCLVQGTLTYGSGAPTTITSAADLTAWVFPFNQGHMRARETSTITTTASSFSSVTPEFDAADATKGIPTVTTAGCARASNGGFSSACRNVFTNTNSTPANGTTFRPTTLDLTDGNSATIGALIAPTSIVGAMTAANYQTLVRKVLAGTSNGTVPKLGGVDRSTPAVIQKSPVATVSSTNNEDTATRPTMVYFGAADGMLHAVCATTGGKAGSNVNVCDQLGRELWSFIPRVQLPLIRVNRAVVDGSVRVVDAFGDFSNPPTGKKGWRTILTFQTGYENASITGALRPATYAIDVTDPTKPILLWEYIRPGTASGDGFDLGVGLAMHAGPTIKGGVITNLAVAVTNNRGTGNNGIVANAISLETGSQVWKFGFAYSDNTMSSTGVPGGAVGVDMKGTGFITDVVFGDLAGNLWKLDAAAGTSSTGSATTPLFKPATGQKRPIGAVPTIFDNGSKAAAFGSGGYVDTEPTASLWTTGTQRLIAVPLSPGSSQITDNSASLVINQPLLNATERVFGQLLIVGNQIFLTTDTANINASAYGTAGATTGNGYGFTIGSSTVTSTGTLQGGASGLINQGTTLFGGASDRQQKLATAATSTTGTSVDTTNNQKPTRLAWLRSSL